MAAYNTGDIAAVNDIIERNGLGWDKAPDDGSSIPDGWTGALWSDSDSDRRITELFLSQQKLVGELNLTALTQLRRLDCRDNRLSALDVGKLYLLSDLDCSYNQLTALNLKDTPAVSFFIGRGQSACVTLSWHRSFQRFEVTTSMTTIFSLARGIKYASGKLIAKDDSLLSTCFAVETGLAGKFLSGELSISYR
ncbi:MAG: hypothetical protein LBD21_02450 [Tannerellaceae bacterium]|jgi:Leucine-rich repeat (LRR) protein|nr:hypothetical protein [Tannerellaceae bacterium]